MFQVSREPRASIQFVHGWPQFVDYCLKIHQKAVTKDAKNPNRAFWHPMLELNGIFTV